MIPPRGFRRAIPGTTAAGDDHPTDPRWRWLNAILLTLGPLILFGPMLIRGEALYWGTPILQFVPWRMLAFKIISLGYLPLWNPYLGMGAPLLANLQSALLYPPNAILALTGPAWGHGLLVLLHLIWAAWGMALLAKRLGLGGLAQLIAGLSFGLSGYMVSRAGFLTINAAASWLPWLILAAERLLQDSPRTGSWTSIIPSSARLSCALALQWLAGHAQTSWYTLTLVLVWLVWRSSEGRATHSPARAIAGLCVALAMAFMLSAVQLLPTLEYLTISQRAGALGRDFALTYSFWPWRILGLLVPNLFGSPATGDYWGYANYWEDAVYIGVLPIVLAGLGIIRGLRRGDGYGRLARLLAITGAVALLLALGKNTPIFPFLFDHIPTFNLFQAPTRLNLLAVFALALPRSTSVVKDVAVVAGTAALATLAVLPFVGGFYSLWAWITEALPGNTAEARDTPSNLSWISSAGPGLATLVYLGAALAIPMIRRRFPREIWLLLPVWVATALAPFVWDHYWLALAPVVWFVVSRVKSDLRLPAFSWIGLAVLPMALSRLGQPGLENRVVPMVLAGASLCVGVVGSSLFIRLRGGAERVD